MRYANEKQRCQSARSRSRRSLSTRTHVHVHRGEMQSIWKMILKDARTLTEVRGARLSLASLHFNISSIQTQPLSVSVSADLHNLLPTVSRPRRAGQLFMDGGSRDKSMLSLFFLVSICIISLRCWVSSFTPRGH